MQMEANHAGHARDRPPEGYSSVMSRESLRLVEAAYEALADRGFEPFAGYWDDDIEWQAIGGRFRGGDAGRAYLQEWSSSFDDLTTEALEFIDVGNDRVVVWVRISGGANGSGIEPPSAYFATFVELRNGKIAWAVEYPTLAEAVEAVSASR
jgi:ketosteroid isomerase-like protein